jgi:hypothetical protein
MSSRSFLTWAAQLEERAKATMTRPPLHTTIVSNSLEVSELLSKQNNLPKGKR